MEALTAALTWISTNGVAIAKIVAEVIGAASVIITLIPTLSKDNWLLPIVKAIAKYIALNKTVNDTDRPAVTPTK